MPAAPDDPVQSRVAQLEAIAARRNELLGQMYHLMRQRHGIGSESDGEGEELQSFLGPFDLHKLGEQGFVKNHLERLLKSSSNYVWPGSGTEDHDMDLPGAKDMAQEVHRASHSSGTEHAEDTDDEKDEFDLISDTQATEPEGVESRSPKRDLETKVEADMEIKEDVKEEVGDNEAMNIDSSPPSNSIGGHTSSSKPPPTVNQIMSHDLSPPAGQTIPPLEKNAIQQAVGAVFPQPEPAPLPIDALTKTTSVSPTQSFPVTNGTPQLLAAQGAGSNQPLIQEDTQTDVGINPSLLIAHKSPITIPIPIEPIHSSDQHSVPVAPLPEKQVPSELQAPRPATKVEYTLPPLQILPPEFSRKKSSKRKKDRSDKKGGDDLPMGLNRWAATLSANPVYTRLKRSTKCLSTKEWSLAIAELRLMRTVERIEKLKLEGRWGFRQTKKQRGVGGLLKTHWDYLMDEMKWMRTDFREERKWKLALAYNLSTSVLEWHALHSWEERVACGICVKWKPIHEKEQGDDEIEGGEDPLDAEEPEEGRHASLLAVDYTSDDDDMEAEEVEPKDVIDALETTTEIQGAIEGATEAREVEDEKVAGGEESFDVSPSVRPKQEDVDDVAALREDNDTTLALSISQKDAQREGSETDPAGLKPTSNDPMMGSKSSSHSLNGDVDEGKANSTKVKINAYAPMREKIVYGPSEKFFIGSDDLDFFVGPEKDKPEQEILHALGLNTLFPELQPFHMLDVAPVVVELTKRKSGRSTDKDDPNRRVEETNYNKVMPSGKFMMLKPTLLGPLQPSKRWKDGKWLPMEEYAISADLDSSNRITEESLCELFEFKAKPSGKGDGPQAKDARPRNDQLWGSNDDLLLKSLVDRYPGNWNLIAECFNGARLTTPSDRRLPTDCQDRWRAKWGTDLQAKSLLTQDSGQGDESNLGSNVDGSLSQSANEPVATGGPSTSAGTTSMTTRGVKRLASASLSSQQAPSVAGAGSEPKKRRRHILIQETIRRASKKRQEHAQKMLANQRKQPGMHDTHIQLQKLPMVGPAELSRQKAEREAAQLAEIQKARARQEELNGKNVPRLAGIPVPPQAAAALQAAQQQQQQTSAPGQAQPQLTPQQIQQHQLLLHAQANRPSSNGAAPVAAPRQGNVNIARISTPSVPPGATAPRLTPQQILQLQQQQQRTLSQQMANGINREPTASPSHGTANSPHGNVGANSPSPGNVPQAGLTPQQAQAAAAGRTGGNHYFVNAAAPGAYSAEQLNGLRMMMLHQQLQQQGQGS